LLKISKLKEEQEHRGNIESISKLFTDAGFIVTRYFEDRWVMKFVDGSAFLNHHFVKLGWISSWLKLVNECDREEVFTHLEQNLNTLAESANGLNLNVPILFIEGEKL